MDLRVRLIQEYNEGESISAMAEVYGQMPRCLPNRDQSEWCQCSHESAVSLALSAKNCWR
jgi:hypothetical protein